MERQNDDLRYALCLENGEDYLYPASYFIFIQLPREAQKALQISA